MIKDSFQRKLDEVKRVIDEDNHRRRVLTLCQQSEPKSFDEYSSNGSFRQLEKFESSTYSEVLKAVDLADNNKPVVMKIMRALSKGVLKLLPSLSSKGCQSYNDILNELVVTQALSQLHEGVLLNGQPNALYKTHFFCQIHEIKVVSGSMEKTLSNSKRREREKARLAMLAQQASKFVKDNLENTKSSSDTTRKTIITNKIQDHQSPPPAATETTTTTTDPSSSETNARLQGPSFAEARRQYERDQEQHGVETDDEEIIDREEPAQKEDPVAEQEEAQQLKEQEANRYEDKKKNQTSDDEQLEEERMLIAALPHEYVVSVMKHDGQPLWWMMTHKKLSSEQLTSVMVQVIVGLAIAEHVYLYEHRDLHVSNILIKKTPDAMIPFVVEGRNYQIVSHGVKATIIDATFSRLTHNGRVYYRDLTSTLRAYGARKTPPRMSLQNRSYRQMVRLTNNRWEEFRPKTNLIWLTYLAETLMKNDIIKSNANLADEIRKIRDYTLKVKTTIELLSCFPFERIKTNNDHRRNSSKSS